MNLALAPDNPMNKAMAGCLVMEVIVFGLAFPGMIMVDDVSLGLAAGACIVACLLCLAAAAKLRTPLGYALGWLAQLAGVALGLLTPTMFIVGIMFLAIWGASFVMGRRLESNAAR
ncbi:MULTISPECIES: DUF4233 domain-containing protein [unclassified Luteococcus]|uniref:DUF4233 domain-containing protein n=1 Tax=unclassified Luteococcus TaxID=2639923 RepID=UPI00313E1D3E